MLAAMLGGMLVLFGRQENIAALKWWGTAYLIGSAAVAVWTIWGAELGHVASLAQARAVLQGAGTSGRPVWLSVTVDDADGRLLRSGEAVADLAPILAAGRARAVLANCSAPAAMAAALAIFRGFGLPFGAYANGFQQINKEFLKDSPTVDVLHARAEMTPALYSDFALRWVDMGATIIGGCCETTPAHIAMIAGRLTAAGHRIV
jgi:homocysteine S-methyltransferase